MIHFFNMHFPVHHYLDFPLRHSGPPPSFRRRPESRLFHSKFRPCLHATGQSHNRKPRPAESSRNWTPVLDLVRDDAHRGDG
jgi:hypothetical protein